MRRLLFLLKYDLIGKDIIYLRISYIWIIIQNYDLKVEALQKHSRLTRHPYLKPHDLNLEDRGHSIPCFPFKFPVPIFSGQIQKVTPWYFIMICPVKSPPFIQLLIDVQ